VSGRVLGVDPGEKRIGVAISDPTAAIASPLRVLQHVSRTADAAQIVQIAQEQSAVLIVIVQPLDENGLAESPEARRSARFAQAVQSQTGLPVILWDESLRRLDAQAIRRVMGVSRRKRQGHLDDLAAAVMLQSYLDSNFKDPPSPSQDLSAQGSPE
jgi:putative Holliday junction resolvase